MNFLIVMEIKNLEFEFFSLYINNFHFLFFILSFVVFWLFKSIIMLILAIEFFISFFYFEII